MDLTQRLVREPSTVGNVASVLRVMEDSLDRLGLHTEKIHVDKEALSSHPGSAPVPWEYDGRYNLVATEPAAGQGGRSVLLNGHLDVVSPEPVDLWDKDPFTQEIRDGRLA